MIARALKLFISCLTLIVVSACSSSGSNLPEPTALNDIKPQLQLAEQWSVSVGKGDNKSTSVMQPVISENDIFAASGQHLVSRDSFLVARRFFDSQETANIRL